MLWPEWRPGPGPWSWLVSLAVWACPTPSLPSPGCRPTRLFFTRTWTCIPRRDCCQHIGLGWIILRRLKDSALFMDLFWHWALIPGGRDYHLSPSQFLLGQIHVGELKPEVRISFRRVHQCSILWRRRMSCTMHGYVCQSVMYCVTFMAPDTLVWSRRLA